MARTTRINLLTARQVQSAGDGEHGDGGGLLLRVKAESASWVLRYTSPTGKRREMGLGVAHRQNTARAGETLAAVRRLAYEARELLRAGTDPLEAREQQRETARQVEEDRLAERQRERWTLARVARDYHERIIEPTRTSKHAAQWISSLENHIPASLWHASVDSIEPPALLSALLEVKPHERARRHKGETVPETLRRIRQRLDSIYEDAIFHKRCVVNPAAAIRRKMREAAPKRQAKGRFAALAYGEAPALMQRLQAAEGTAARALELAVLCAARTGEIIGAEWCEFDLDAGTWTVPAARMKAKEPHTVYLSQRAVDVLKSVQGLHERIVFPSPVLKDKPLSNMAMLAVLERLDARNATTVHGLCRATFSTWANETGAARPDVIEACLAHEEGNRVRAAYNRAQFADERRTLLRAWADFLARPAAQVHELVSRHA